MTSAKSGTLMFMVITHISPNTFHISVSNGGVFSSSNMEVSVMKGVKVGLSVQQCVLQKDERCS